MKAKMKISKDDTLQSLFAKAGALGLEYQKDLDNLVNNDNYELDIEKGRIKWDDEREFDFQLLGTLHMENDMWNWAWDNEGVGFPDKILQEANKIKEFGETYDIAQFKENIFEASVHEAHILAMTVTGLFKDDGYFVVDLNEMVFFITVKSDKIPHNNTVENFLYTYNTFQKEYEVPPRVALEGYAKLHGYQYKESEEFSSVKIGESHIMVGINERGKVSHIQTMLGDEDK